MWDCIVSSSTSQVYGCTFCDPWTNILMLVEKLTYHHDVSKCMEYNACMVFHIIKALSKMLCQQTKQGEMIESTFIMKIIHIKNRRIADIEISQGH